MNENPFIGAYWPARKESRRECAERITRFLLSIQDHAAFARWIPKTRSRKSVSVPLEITVDAIEQRLKTNNRDTDGTAIQELGFNLSIWNGSDEASASFSVTCGAFSNFVKNSAVLYLPPQPSPIDAASRTVLRSFLEKSVAAWDPEDAVATSNEFMTRKGGGMPWVAGGWFVYRRGKGTTIAAEA